MCMETKFSKCVFNQHGLVCKRDSGAKRRAATFDVIELQIVVVALLLLDCINNTTTSI